MKARVIDTSTAPFYRWGEDCEGWRLADHAALSVIEERVPAGAGETRHLHRKARQFFYILAGRAAFEIDGIVHELSAGQGIQVEPGEPHCFRNPFDTEVRFLVVSAPSTRDDRENLD